MGPESGEVCVCWARGTERRQRGQREEGTQEERCVWTGCGRQKSYKNLGSSPQMVCPLWRSAMGHTQRSHCNTHTQKVHSEVTEEEFGTYELLVNKDAESKVFLFFYMPRLPESRCWKKLWNAPSSLVLLCSWCGYYNTDIARKIHFPFKTSRNQRDCVGTCQIT